MRNPLNRRKFLQTLTACGVSGPALSGMLNRRDTALGPQSTTSPNATAWSSPPVLTNPNILLIMLDQLRAPVWLNSTQLATLNQQYLPNIWGRVRNHSFSFQQYYVAAAVCTASRATLLTGLYAPQTAAYINAEQAGPAAPLNPCFPTWGEAVPALNPGYRDNCWWFGKWHLSTCANSTPLLGYGFKTRTYPGSASKNPSPNGYPNEGASGGLFAGRTYASDSEICDDFIQWLQSQPSGPWCAAVSLLNPHDIADAPAWLQTSPFPPVGVPKMPVYFPPPPFPPFSGMAPIYDSFPNPWNYENLQKVTSKPALHYAFQRCLSAGLGVVKDWTLFLNQYYWLQYYADQQVGRVLDALNNSGCAGNTVIVFTSDHGEYAGSHGLHEKGYAAYDECIHVPLFVQFPGQSTFITMGQMCSSVDIFGLICDLATSGGGFWQHGPQAYPDLNSRQSIWNFLYANVPETRIAPVLGIPYVLYTCDGTTAAGGVTKAHIASLRTKTNPNNSAQPGAKLAIYSEWETCSTVPNSTPPDMEFYDYNPATSNNRSEMGNDYYSSNATTQTTIQQYESVLGRWGSPGTGLIATELNAPLAGTGTDGRPLSNAQATARRNYLNAVAGAGACTTG